MQAYSLVQSQSLGSSPPPPPRPPPPPPHFSVIPRFRLILLVQSHLLFRLIPLGSLIPLVQSHFGSVSVPWFVPPPGSVGSDSFPGSVSSLVQAYSSWFSLIPLVQSRSPGSSPPPHPPPPPPGFSVIPRYRLIPGSGLIHCSGLIPWFNLRPLVQFKSPSLCPLPPPPFSVIHMVQSQSPGSVSVPWFISPLGSGVYVQNTSAID